MEALLYETLDKERVRCNLCSHRCTISDGRTGICRVRENRGGKLHTLVYGKLVAQSVDPIEKKPIFHLMPGSGSYSVATAGCNFSCHFCQNASIAQIPAEYIKQMPVATTRPEEVVTNALARNCSSIAYTYTEPTVFFEFALDTATRAHEKGLKNIFVTNGYMTPEALGMIGPFLDAANVDLKSFSDSFYKKYCGARLEPVKETIRAMKARGILVEVTTLIIPGLNDDPEELADLARFIATKAGRETPWHISRFHPAHRMRDIRPTPVATLTKAREIGTSAGLKYVYTGNVPGDMGENTYCHQCGRILIRRSGYTIYNTFIKESRCPDCGAEIDGVEL